MEATPASDAAIEAPAAESRKSAHEKPGRLLLFAFGWMFACEVAAGFTAFVSSFTNRAILHGPGVPSYISFPAALFSTQIVFLLAAFHRGRIIAGDGTLAAALGYVPMTRRWPMILAAIIILLWSALFAVARLANPAPVPSSYAIDIDSAFATGGWITVILISLGTVVLSPIAEELFFRGWLWESLRRHWRPVPVMLGTAVPWLLIHVADNWRSIIILAPEAVCFSLVRHFCGSVRASMVLHVINNIVAVGFTIWFFKVPR